MTEFRRIKNEADVFYKGAKIVWDDDIDPAISEAWGDERSVAGVPLLWDEKAGAWVVMPPLPELATQLLEQSDNKDIGAMLGALRTFYPPVRD